MLLYSTTFGTENNIIIICAENTHKNPLFRYVTTILRQTINVYVIQFMYSIQRTAEAISNSIIAAHHRASDTPSSTRRHFADGLVIIDHVIFNWGGRE